MLAEVCAASRLTLYDEALELLTTALLAVGDTDGDGEMAYSELQALLASRGMRLDAEGNVLEGNWVRGNLVITFPWQACC